MTTLSQLGMNSSGYGIAPIPTLAIGLQEYVTQGNTDWNQLMAAAVVVSLPVVVGFLALQRYLVRGLTAGSVK